MSKSVCIRIEDDVLAKIDEMAKEHGKSRTS